MHLANLPICEKHRLVERMNEEIHAQREKLLASLSADELAVYRVVVAVQVMKQHSQSAVVPKRSRSPKMKAVRGQLRLMIEQASKRYIELENEGQLPALVQRLEGLALLPY